MNIKKITEIKNIGKEKLLLLALAGIMLIGASYFESVKDSKTGEEITTLDQMTEDNYQSKMEKKVENLLESIKGVSNVSVIISLKSGGEKILQEDSEQSSSDKTSGNDSDKSSSVKRTTVIFQQNGKENPYVVKEIYPEIEGIAVSAKGISDSGVKEEVVNMLAALFNVPVHKISVLEMK